MDFFYFGNVGSGWWTTARGKREIPVAKGKCSRQKRNRSHQKKKKKKKKTAKKKKKKKKKKKSS